MNYFAILGVTQDAGLSEIKEAYKAIVRTSHPDRSLESSTASFQLIQIAWETLRDDDRRREYIKKLSSSSQTNS